MNPRRLAMLLTIALVGCGGGSDDDPGANVGAGDGIEGDAGDGALPTADTPLSAPTASAPEAGGTLVASGGAGLVLQLDPACAVAGETVALTLRSRDATVGLDEGADDGLGLNVSAFATVESAGGAAVDLVSRDDVSVRVSLPEPGIAGLTARVDVGSVTRFLAAWPVDAPAESVLLQRVAGGACLVSLRLTDYCGTVRPGPQAFRLGLGERVIEGAGCGDLDNPNGYPVIETR